MHTLQLIMSKKLAKKNFDRSSQVSTKYYENLKQAASRETANPSPLVGETQSYSATDSIIPNDSYTLSEEPNKSKISRSASSWLKFGTPVLAVFLFFWNLNASVNEVKTKTDDINVKISGL